MKKIKKKSVKKRPSKKKSIKKIPTKKKPVKKIPTKNKPVKKIPTKKKPIKKIPTKNKSFKKIIIRRRKSLMSRIIKLQYSLKPELKIKINFSLEKYVQTFFDMIANTILDYKILKEENKRKRKLDEIEKKENERILLQKKKLEEEGIQTK